MHTCDDCNQTFDSHLEKANHIRWNHKETTFTESGRQKNRETAIRVNESRWGRKITEIRRCPKCESSFEVSYREKNPDKVKKFCSRSCANSRNWHTPEARKRLSDIAKANPVWTANSGKPQSNRFSSKAERALAAELRENFRRHLQAKLDSGRRIDVDIAHKELPIWIESDGIFHFEKVHEGHDFEKSLGRDKEQGEHCCDNGILLLRVRNDRHSIEEQIAFIQCEIENWNGAGKVVTLY